MSPFVPDTRDNSDGSSALQSAAQSREEVAEHLLYVDPFRHKSAERHFIHSHKMIGGIFASSMPFVHSNKNSSRPSSDSSAEISMSTGLPLSRTCRNAETFSGVDLVKVVENETGTADLLAASVAADADAISPALKPIIVDTTLTFPILNRSIP